MLAPTSCYHHRPYPLQAVEVQVSRTPSTPCRGTCETWEVLALLFLFLFLFRLFLQKTLTRFVQRGFIQSIHPHSFEM